MSKIIIKQYTHYPNSTELGKGNTHDSYMRIPKEYAPSVLTMFPLNEEFNVYDELKHKFYNLKLVQNANELRLNKFGPLYRDHDVDYGDEITITSFSINDEVKYYINVKKITSVIFKFNAKKQLFELSNYNKLPNFSEKNKDYKIQIKYNGIQQTLLIKFNGPDDKRRDSPGTTDYYSLKFQDSESDFFDKDNNVYSLDINTFEFKPFTSHDYNEVVIDPNLILDSSLNEHSALIESNNSNFSHQKIYFGAPGTGKSYEVNQITKQYKDTVRTTFYPESDYSTFVGSYKPTTTSDGQIIYEFCPQVFIKAYVQAWSKLIHFEETNPNPNNGDKQQDNSKLLVNEPSSSKPLDESHSNSNAHPTPQFLVIEEINRGNCAQIFGDLFQLLDRNDQGFSSYPIEANLDLQKYLAQEFERQELNFDVLDNLANENNFDLNRLQNGEILYLPRNLYIYTTMNTSDQSLFPIDSAFKRRWDWEYVPIAEGKDPKGEPLDYCIRIKNVQSEQNDQANNQTNIHEYLYFDWWDFIQKINTRIQTLTNSEDKKLGYFFCKANRYGYIPANKFVGKVLFYLWNDVFKDFGLDPNICKAQDEKGENIELTFDKFYQIDQQNNQDEESKGINLKNVITFLDNLEVSKKELQKFESTNIDNQSQGLNNNQNNNYVDSSTDSNQEYPSFMNNISNL